jgi:CRISPR-associated endoribonuclease Cas6
MEASGKFTTEQIASFYKFQLVADQEYIHRLQESHKKFARIYPLYDNDVRFEVRGYTFPFKLYAAIEVQQFIYENGLGLYTSKGFGMLDLANNDTIQRQEERQVSYA